MKLSFSFKKPESANTDNKIEKVDSEALKNISNFFSVNDNDVKPNTKSSIALQVASENEPTRIASEVKPFKLEIKFKETPKASDDPVLTQYDEFIQPSREASFKPVYLGFGAKHEGPELSERPKARYVEKLIKTAQKREIERDLMIGKKEREEAQGEVFVTSAYRKKLEEREEIIRKMKEQDELDEFEGENKDLSALHKNMLDSKGWKRRRV